MAVKETNSETNETAKSKLPVYICPGFHESVLTERFVRSLPSFTQPHIFTAFPADPIAVFRWLTQHWLSQQKYSPIAPITAIGFSAGVVGMAGALTLWQQQGKKVARFFAVDGWGMPIAGLPTCRLSHDEFTHWSSLPLGAGKVNFYADPAVEHLALWENPERALGWQVNDWEGGRSKGIATTASIFLNAQLQIEWQKMSVL